MEQVRILLEKYLACGLITQQQYNAVLWRYGLDGQGYRSMKEVGKLLGVSASRPQVILFHAFKRLRSQDDFFAVMNAHLVEHPLPKRMRSPGVFTVNGLLQAPFPLTKKHYQIVEEPC